MLRIKVFQYFFYYFILIPSRSIIIRCSVSCVLNCTRVAPSCVTCLTLAAAGLSAYVVWFFLNNTCRTCTCMIGWCKARLLWHCTVSSCRHGLPSVSRRTRQTPPVSPCLPHMHEPGGKMPSHNYMYMYCDTPVHPRPLMSGTPDDSRQHHLHANVCE